MLLRLATLADLKACIALDADSQTDHVWQMEERRENGGITVRFQTVRLPRLMRVTYPRRRDDLVACWKGGSYVLVAGEPKRQDAEVDPAGRQAGRLAQVYGYCQLDALAWQGTGWISHLVVARSRRRQGIGSAMLKAGRLWGRKNKLKRLMVAVQTKNYPGIRLCEKLGFVFSGFNDHYYPNRDIALFFSLRI